MKLNRNKIIGSMWDVVIVSWLIFCFALLIVALYVAVHFIRKFW